MLTCAAIQLDRKLVEDLGNHLEVSNTPDLFGVEVELEGRNILTSKLEIITYWTTHADASLRVHKPGANAIEYVFRSPLTMENTTAALKNLFDFLNSPGVEVFDSYRTSIHVHVNCLQETIRTIVNFITLAIIFDELFVSQNGETRIGNNFCLRSRDAEGQIADLMVSMQTYGNFYSIQKENRYSSVNIASLMKFGTIEFRSLECTTDFDRMMHWIKTLQALKEAARKYENPREIISEFSKNSPHGFMMKVLGDQSYKYLKVPQYHNMLLSGMRLAQDFAYCSDWRMKSTKASPEETPKPKRKPGWAEHNVYIPPFQPIPQNLGENAEQPVILAHPWVNFVNVGQN